MADLVITATAVLPAGNNSTSTGVAGATLTAGKPVYLDPTDNRWKLADNNAGSAGDPVRTASGISANGASAGQPCEVIAGGDVQMNAVLTAGVSYYLSGTAGGICPVADLTTGMQTQLIGIAKSTTVLALSFFTAGSVL